MKVWTCTDHETHWPVGAASVVVAETEPMAMALLVEALKAHGLEQPLGKFTLQELDTETENAVVLCDGNY